MKLGIVFDQIMTLHYDSVGHPECPERILKIYHYILKNKLVGHRSGQFKPINSRYALMDELLLCHSSDYLEQFKKTAYDSKARLLLEDNSNSIYINQDTWRCALLATGSVLELAYSINSGEIDAGVAIVRPPGHHACRSAPMGFCFFNHVAIASLKLAQLGEKVLIVDWDVHDGNGTRELVHGKEGIMFYSIHRYDNGAFYPGTGVPGEVNNTKSVGFNNIIAGDIHYITEFKKISAWLANNNFKPTIIVISAGFDAAKGDPLGGYNVTPEGYARLTTILQEISKRVLIVLEGGYNLKSITVSLLACMYQLIENQSM